MDEDADNEIIANSLKRGSGLGNSGFCGGPG
jgi:hypothetical protein